ncbi:zinc-ribbon domain-containing protein [Pseudonocardiaceae bacterium YIM PH 21723]|nr:zinc-ribbon domain-containing protein [Pseudonocardiaceae bacterium YIM PH 21723]
MILFGWRRSAKFLAHLSLVCPNCRNPAAHTLHKLSTWFTLFFIPLIPLRFRWVVQCTFCGYSEQVTSTTAFNLQQSQHPQASQQQQPFAPQQPYPPR